MSESTQTPAAASAAGITLISASPRRRRLLALLGLPFTATHVDTPEDLTGPLASNPEALAAHIAAEKTLAAREQGVAGEGLALAFDTIVVLDGEILGKPVDVDDAWRMLRALSGRVHQVVTGVALLCPSHEEPRTFAVTTDVHMKELDDDAIRDWMAQDEFMGCAGAYNIEKQVAEVDSDECHQNVAGLPLCHVYAMLRGGEVACRFGTPEPPVAECEALFEHRCELGRLLASG